MLYGQEKLQSGVGVLNFSKGKAIINTPMTRTIVCEHKRLENPSQINTCSMSFLRTVVIDI